jgi:carboxypeptidase C (cathepsin A)
MTGHYESGHMVYIDAAAMVKMRADMRRFYEGAMNAK